MTCTIKRNKNNEIVQVTAPNGQPSALYRDLTDFVKNHKEHVLAKEKPLLEDALRKGAITNINDPKEIALVLWAKTHTDKFKNWFGDFETKPNHTRATVKEKYKGKVILANSGTGKTFSTRMSKDIIDTDNLLAETLGVQVKDIVPTLSLLSNEQKKAVQNEVRRKIEIAISQGFTVVTPSFEFADMADEAILQKNPFVLQQATKSTDRENPYDRSTYLYDQAVKRLETIVKNRNIPTKSLKEDQFLADELFDDYQSTIVYKNISNAIDEKLARYLLNFGISIKELPNLRKELVSNNNLPFLYDMLNKIAVVDSSDPDSMPYAAAHFIAFMMQHKQEYKDVANIIRSRFEKKISQAQIHETITKHIYDELMKRKKTRTPLSVAIRKLIDRFWQYITGKDFVEKSVSSWVDRILNNDTILVDAPTKPGENKLVDVVFLGQALNQDKFAREVITKFSIENDYELTGSASYANQGATFRDPKAILHDIDFVTNKPIGQIKKDVNEAGFSLAPVRKIRDAKNPSQIATYTYVMTKKGHLVTNMKMSGFKLISYQVKNKDGKVIGDFKKTKNGDVYRGEAGRLVDFMRGDKDKKPPIKVSTKYGEVSVSSWQSSFSKKLEYSRDKDIWDYQKFVIREKYQDDTYNFYDDYNPYEKININHSLLVDENGEPKLFYHGSPAGEISSFDLTRQSFFTSNIKLAKTFGDNIYPVFINAKDAIKINHNNRSRFDPSSLRYAEVITEENLQKHDAIIIQNTFSQNANQFNPNLFGDTIVVPKEKGYVIKSLFNKTQYNPTSQNIYYELEGTEVETGMSSFHEQKILAGLSNSGITVTTIKKYKEGAEARGQQIPDGVSAVADIANKTLALKDGDSLPEEVAHFAIAVAAEKQTRGFRRAYRRVVQHPMYEKYKEEYMATRDYDEHKYRLEIMGKIAASQAFNKYKPGTLAYYLAEIVRFVRRLFGDFYLRMGQDVSTGNIDTAALNDLKNSGDKFYALKAVTFDKLKKQIDNAQAYLNKKFLNADRESARYKRGKNIQEALNELKDMAEYDMGVVKILQFLEDDLNSLMSDIEQFQKRNIGNNSRKAILQGPIELNYVKEFLDFYRPMISQISQYIADKDKLKTSLPEERFKKVINNMGITAQGFTDLQKVESKIDALRVSFGKAQDWYYKQNSKQVEKLLHRWIDETITDPQKAAREKQIISENLSEVGYDSQLGHYFFGSLLDSKDEIARLVYSKMKDINHEIRNRTRRMAEDLLKKKEELGITDSSKIYDAKTHYYVTPYDREAYEAAKKKFFEDLATQYGLPLDKDEGVEERDRRRYWVPLVEYYRGHKKEAKNFKYIYREGGRDGEVGFTNDYDPSLDFIQPIDQFVSSDKFQHGVDMIDYGRETAKWYRKHAPARKDAAQIEARLKRKWGANSQKFRAWAHHNIGYSRNGIPYYRNDMTAPSATLYPNPKYNELSANEKKYLDYIIEKKRDLDLLLPFYTDTYKRPQIKADMINAVASKHGNVMEAIKEGFNFVIDSDDTQFGEIEPTLRSDGSVAHFVPTHFIRSVDNPERLSNNVESDLIMYMQMAQNFNEKSKQVNLFEQVLDAVGSREVNMQQTRMSGKDSRVYKAMQQFMEQQLYGLYKVRGPHDEVEMFGYKVSLAKIMDKFNKYITKTNLAMRLSTALTGTFTSQFNLALERAVGTYIGKKSYRKAMNEYRKYMHSAFLESGKAVKKNKMSRVFQTHYVLQDVEQQFSRLDIKSNKARKAFKDKGYLPYTISEHGVKGAGAIAIMQNTRLHDGVFKPVHELKRQGVDNWQDLPSYWDAINENGTSFQSGLTIKNPVQEKRNMSKKIEYILNKVDGKISMEDRAHIHRHFIWQLLATHRGWLQRGYAERFKSLGKKKIIEVTDPDTGEVRKEEVWEGGLNYTTGEREEGYYPTTWRFALKTIFSKDRMLNLRNALKEYNQLEPWQQDGVRRALTELAMTSAFLTVIMGINHLAADDDEEENFILQYAAYISTRVFLEISALQMIPVPALGIREDTGKLYPEFSVFPPAYSQLIEVLQSPIAGTQQLDTILELANLIQFNEKVESGPYEGMTRGGRFLRKATPYVKGITGDRDPAASNQYLKYKSLGWAF